MERKLEPNLPLNLIELERAELEQQANALLARTRDVFGRVMEYFQIETEVPRIREDIPIPQVAGEGGYVKAISFDYPVELSLPIIRLPSPSTLTSTPTLAARLSMVYDYPKDRRLAINPNRALKIVPDEVPDSTEISYLCIIPRFQFSKAPFRSEQPRTVSGDHAQLMSEDLAHDYYSVPHPPQGIRHPLYDPTNRRNDWGVAQTLPPEGLSSGVLALHRRNGEAFARALDLIDQSFQDLSLNPLPKDENPQAALF